MRISVKLDSAAIKEQLRKLGDEAGKKVKTAVKQAMTAQTDDIRKEVRDHVASEMTVVRKGFLKSFVARVLDKQPDRLPALYIGSKIPWVGIHETGGAIGAKMLIPLHGRVGRKTFKKQVTELLRGGNAYFVKNAKGHVVLMAENIKEHDRPLAGFKRRYRKAAGIKRLKRGADIPIAVLVPKVTLKKRLDINRLAVQCIPRLALAIKNKIMSSL